MHQWQSEGYMSLSLQLKYVNTVCRMYYVDVANRFCMLWNSCG